MTQKELAQQLINLNISEQVVSTPVAHHISDIFYHAQTCKKFKGIVVATHNIAAQYLYRHVITCHCGMKWFMDDSMMTYRLGGQSIHEIIAHINANYSESKTADSSDTSSDFSDEIPACLHNLIANIEI